MRQLYPLLFLMLLLFLVACNAKNPASPEITTAPEITTTIALQTTAPSTTEALVITTQPAQTTASPTTTAPEATTPPITTAPPLTTTPSAPAVSVPTVNGTPISEYTILITNENDADARMLARLLYDRYSVTLPIAEEAVGPAFLLATNENCNMNSCMASAVGTTVTIEGRGKNGTYLAARALCDMLSEAMEEGNGEIVLGSDATTKSVTSYLAKSTRQLFLSDGSIDNFRGGELNIAFLGGSLTQSKTAWTEPVANMFRQWFPEKTINCLNAGIGATNSELGAARLQKDVLSKMTPDILFVDYAVNDGGYATESDEAIIKNGAYIEGIIKQCRELENPPIIILLYFPVGQRMGGTTYNNWKNGVELKDRIAENYGIGTIDVWERFEALYLEAIKETPSLTYNEFLLRYYAPTDMTHPMDVGFAIFGDAIIDALEAAPENYLINRYYAETYLTEFESISSLKYDLLGPDDERIEIDGEFSHYTTTTFAEDDPRYVPGIRVSEAQLTKGVLQNDDGEGFAISITTTARYIKFYGIQSPSGMTVDVYADGVLMGSVSTKANNTYLYIRGVELFEGGEPCNITILSPSELGEDTVFRFGYIILAE